MLEMSGEIVLSSYETTGRGASVDSATSRISLGSIDDIRAWLQKNPKAATPPDLCRYARSEQKPVKGIAAMLFCGDIFDKSFLLSKLGIADQISPRTNCADIALLTCEKWGVQFVKEIEGTFSCTMYDLKQEVAFLFRDRLGSQPLFYSFDNKGLVFSPRIKRIHSNRRISRTISIRAMSQFLGLSYIPAPSTIYESILKLEAGCVFALCLRSGKTSILRLWSTNIKHEGEYSDFPPCANHLRSTIESSVSARMSKNGSVGAFLSGGIDSTVIVSCMAETSEQPIDAFTIGFED